METERSIPCLARHTDTLYIIYLRLTRNACSTYRNKLDVRFNSSQDLHFNLKSILTLVVNVYLDSIRFMSLRFKNREQGGYLMRVNSAGHAPIILKSHDVTTLMEICAVAMKLVWR